jgi:hypothetical protein
MKRRFLASTRSIALLTIAIVATPASATTFSDDFETYTVGTFPSPTWQDVRSIPNSAPIPSALVVATTDADGNPTQALHTVDALSPSKGVYATVDPAAIHRAGIDFRIDRYGTPGPGATPPDDYAAGIAVVDVLPSDDFCCVPVPQVGVWVSALTKEFLLYGFDSVGAILSIGLGVTANEGDWYSIDFELNAGGGVIRTVISSLGAGGMLLVDRTDAVPGWTASAFDAVAIFGGETSTGVTVATLTTVDDLRYDGEGIVPEPGTLSLVLLGLVATAARRRGGRPRRESL